MQIKSITVDAVSLASAQAIRKNGAPIQPESNLFGPSCLVTISREGKNLSRQQAIQNGQDTEGVKDVRKQLRQMEKAEQEKKAEEDYREELHDAEKAEKAEKIAKALSNPDEDDVLKAALREGREMSRGGALTEEDLVELEDEYEWLCEKMAEGRIQVSVEEFSDGIIDDRKHIHIRRIGSEDKCRIEAGHVEKAVGSLDIPDEEKARAIKSSWTIPGLKEKKYEEFKAGFKELRSWMTKMHMVPSLLERYSEAEMSERIERYFEGIFELSYAIGGWTDASLTDEALAELNEKLLADQMPLSEQEKAVEDFARRLASADSTNVTRIESGDFTALPDMPENEGLQ